VSFNEFGDWPVINYYREITLRTAACLRSHAMSYYKCTTCGCIVHVPYGKCPECNNFTLVPHYKRDDPPPVRRPDATSGCLAVLVAGSLVALGFAQHAAEEVIGSAQHRTSGQLVPPVKRVLAERALRER
jgi:hypothetical protein